GLNRGTGEHDPGVQDELLLVSPDELVRLRDAPDELLSAAVQTGAGLSSALPSSAQFALHADILTAMTSAGQIAAVVPDGAGFPALSAAVLSAVERGDRTLLSTQSPTRVRQMRDVTVPAVLAATRHLDPNADVKIAFVLDESGYVDPAKVIATA